MILYQTQWLYGSFFKTSLSMWFLQITGRTIFPVCRVSVNFYCTVLLIIFHTGSAEDGIIPGRLVPEVCHAEAHTDYGGIAVRWGPTHHVESAADCCEACLKQARSAKRGEKKCNIWVFCPAEGGCFSPDVYEHKHQECWLKQVSTLKFRLVEKIGFSCVYVFLITSTRAKTWVCHNVQAVEPELNFKGHYDEEYRRLHPTAPRIVPWVSGVVQ